jgi:hypothetical protein
VSEPVLRRFGFATTLHVEAADAAALAGVGLDTLDAFRGDPRDAAGRTLRSVGRVEAGGRTYYVKRYDYGGLRILRTFLYRAKADREFEYLGRVRAAGVPAVRPVAWGVRRALGFVPASALITEAFEGSVDVRALVTDYVFGRPGAVPRAAFREVLDRIADGLRALHAQGIYLHTAFEKNVLVRMRDGKAEYAWADLPFAGRCAPGRLPRRRRVRDLACLNKGLEAALAGPDRLRLLRRYLGPGASRPDLRSFAAAVVRKTRALQNRTPGARLVKILKGG